MPHPWKTKNRGNLGRPGTGKSHIAKAIALLGVERGYKVHYREAHQLIEDLTEARELGELSKYRAQLKAADLLVIDASAAMPSLKAATLRPPVLDPPCSHPINTGGFFACANTLRGIEAAMPSAKQSLRRLFIHPLSVCANYAHILDRLFMAAEFGRRSACHIAAIDDPRQATLSCRSGWSVQE